MNKTESYLEGQSWSQVNLLTSVRTTRSVSLWWITYYIWTYVCKFWEWLKTTTKRIISLKVSLRWVFHTYSGRFIDSVILPSSLIRLTDVWDTSGSPRLFLPVEHNKLMLSRFKQASIQSSQRLVLSHLLIEKNSRKTLYDIPIRRC